MQPFAIVFDFILTLITYSAEIRKALASLFKRPKLAQADQVRINLTILTPL